jgi:uncharacterized protein (DUF488 family)
MDLERKLESSQLSLFSATSENGQTFERSSREDIPSILSIGYEKRNTDSFLETLIEYKIQAVVDVRQSAFSRRLDFRKLRLISLLDNSGIEYFHLRSAGNPHRNTSNNLNECLKLYYDYISDEPTLINEIASELNHISQSYPRMAMLCYEKCPSECHRTILINVLKANNFKCSVFEV